MSIIRVDPGKVSVILQVRRVSCCKCGKRLVPGDKAAMFIRTKISPSRFVSLGPDYECEACYVNGGK